MNNSKTRRSEKEREELQPGSDVALASYLPPPEKATVKSAVFEMDSLDGLTANEAERQQAQSGHAHSPSPTKMKLETLHMNTRLSLTSKSVKASCFHDCPYECSCLVMIGVLGDLVTITS